MLRDRLIELPGVEVGVAQIRADNERDRVQLQRSVRLRKRLLEPAHVAEADGIPMMGRREAWLQFDGASELGLRPSPIPIIEELHSSQRGVRLGEMLVQLQRFESRGARRRIALQRRAARIQGHENVRVRDAGVGNGVPRINSGRPLEIVQSLGEPVLSAFVPVVPPSEIKLVGLRVDRPRGRAGSWFARRKLYVDSLGDVASHLALHCQDVPRIAVVALRPEVPILCGLDELNLDAHPVV